MEVALVLLVLAATVALFVSDRLPSPLVAMMVLALLLLVSLAGPFLPGFNPAHWITVEEGVAGFGNPATVTVAAMFVLSAALEKTGVLTALARMLGRLAHTPTLLLMVMMIAVAGASAFINNTAAVAVFMPVAIGAAAACRVSPSRLLIPLSYAAQFGGVCTLIGTSTNLLVSAISERHGAGAFRMFEFTPFGVLLALTGLLYLAFGSRWLLPDRPVGDELAAKAADTGQSVPDPAQPQDAPAEKHRIFVEEARPLLVLGTLFAVVFFAATGVLPMMVSALFGCIVLVGTRCLSIEDACSAIDWKVVFLLAGMLPLGLAMEKSGAAALLADAALAVARPLGPIAVVAMLYLLAAVLTEFMSNNATAVLLAPLALALAKALEIDPRPLLMAVCFAASTSFCTPVGYQTNAMVQGPGGYRFNDYLRIGLPLNILFFILSVWFIPQFWPF
jgi:solute carrier family 13 (sodium-dependent dicarboxylate transporter), member 2/3/5